MAHPFVDAAFSILAQRAQGVALPLVLGLLLGNLAGGMPGALLARIVRFGRKLNRQKRGAATLVYRGIVALLLLLIPGIALGTALDRLPLPGQWLILIVIFGASLNFMPTLNLAQRIGRSGQKLELPNLDYLFADMHGLLRYSILRSAIGFAVGAVGTSFWYVLGGFTLAVPYLLLAACAYGFSGVAFGWAARGLFRLMDFLPRSFTILLLLVASPLVPHTHPLATRKARSWHGFVALLLGISLGGALPHHSLPWAGTGTAKIDPAHLRRWLTLLAAASVLLLFALSAGEIHKLLDLFIS